jgi:hypothetical protein
VQYPHMQLLMRWELLPNLMHQITNFPIRDTHERVVADTVAFLRWAAYRIYLYSACGEYSVYTAYKIYLYSACGEYSVYTAYKIYTSLAISVMIAGWSPRTT